MLILNKQASNTLNLQWHSSVLFKQIFFVFIFDWFDIVTAIFSCHIHVTLSFMNTLGFCGPHSWQILLKVEKTTATIRKNIRNFNRIRIQIEVTVVTFVSTKSVLNHIFWQNQWYLISGSSTRRPNELRGFNLV